MSDCTSIPARWGDFDQADNFVGDSYNDINSVHELHTAGMETDSGTYLPSDAFTTALGELETLANIRVNIDLSGPMAYKTLSPDISTLMNGKIDMMVNASKEDAPMDVQIPLRCLHRLGPLLPKLWKYRNEFNFEALNKLIGDILHVSMSPPQKTSRGKVLPTISLPMILLIRHSLRRRQPLPAPGLSPSYLATMGLLIAFTDTLYRPWTIIQGRKVWNFISCPIMDVSV